MENIEEILNNKRIKKIFQIKNYENVYLLLEMFVETYSTDFITRKKLQNKLFIIYLQELENESKKGNLYERLLCSFIDKPYNTEIISYILSKDINLNYKTMDNSGVSLSLPYILANNLEDKDCIQLFLQKLKNSNNIFFRNPFYKNYSDLCLMNIKAGNLEEAYKTFLNPRYKLFNTDYLDIKEIKEELIKNFELAIPGLDVYHDDLLFKIIATIRYSNLEDDQKQVFLINILKSDKIIFFNYLNLKLIEEIFDVTTYKKFLEYLKKQVELEEIILFNISPSNQNTIYLTTLKNQNKLKK